MRHVHTTRRPGPCALVSFSDGSRKRVLAMQPRPQDLWSRKAAEIMWLAVLAVLGLAAQAVEVDICGRNPNPDPCLPGGVWDPILNRCSGYIMGLDCYQCYSGRLCKSKEDSLACAMTLDSGNPMFIAEYWLNRTGREPCTTTPAHYRPEYQIAPTGMAYMLAPLKEAIQELHAVTGNAKTEGYEVVGGMGATMVLHATLIALSRQILQACPSNCPSTVEVLVQPPHYNLYPDIVSLVSTTHWNLSADPTSPYTIEILTYPNNPDGQFRKPLVQNSTHVIRDMVYYWPIYTNTSDIIAEPIMVFSSSKHDGLAGTRFGWGLYQDPKLASGVAHAVVGLMLGLSVDAQLRVLSSLQAVLNDNPSPFGLLPFHSATREVLYNRFQQLASVLTCAQLTNSLSSPGAYAWVRCAEGVLCMEFFQKVNLTVESGEVFGSTSQYARMTMLMPSVEFTILVHKIEVLCDAV